MIDTVTPPQDIDKEIRLLNALVSNPEYVPYVIPFLKPNHFYDEPHQIIYEVILYLFDIGTPIDILLIVNELRKRKKLESVGGTAYVTMLGDYISIDVKTVVIYATQLSELWIRREAIRLCMEAEMIAIDESVDVYTDLIECAISSLEDLDIRSQLKESYATHVDNACNTIVNVAQGTEEPYFDLPHKELAALLKLTIRRFFVFAASGKVGKSKKTTRIMVDLLQKYNDIAIDWHSYELNEFELVVQLIACITGLTESQIKGENYILNEEELKSIEIARDTIKKWKISFTTKTQTVEGIASAHSLFVKKYSKDTGEVQNIRTMLIIDNLGGVQWSYPKRSKDENSEHTSLQLQQLRDKTNSCIIAIHHLTKEVKSEEGAFAGGYRPRIEHVRGSTRVTDFANAVFLFNSFGNYPDIREDEKVSSPEYATEKGHAIDELFIIECAFTRHGKPGIVREVCNLDNNYFTKWNKVKAATQEEKTIYKEDPDEQFAQLWELNKVLMKNSTYDDARMMFNDVIRRGAKCGTEKVDFPFLYERYKAYMLYVKKLNHQRDPNFKDYQTKIVPVEQWLEEGKYIEQYDTSIMISPRHLYLYGTE